MHITSSIILGLICCAGVSTSALAQAPAQAPAPVIERTADEKKAFDIYKTIIEMRTAPGFDMVPKMADYLADELKSVGFAGEDIHIVPAGDSTSLVVRYTGDGSSGNKPILFLGHMDVVDAKRDDWELDPFKLTEKDGYYFGRGTIDNKYGIANLTQTFMRLKKQGFTPNRDLVLVFTGDEEYAMATTQMLAHDRKDLTDAEFALNSDGGGGSVDADGKPLGYGIQAAEKTYATFELTVRNDGGHSSRPKRDDNAIYDLSNALQAIQAYQFPVKSNSITRQNFANLGKSVEGDLGEAMVRFAKNPKNKRAAKRISEDPIYVGFLRTTCIATMLTAGHAENALPQSATATVNCRIFPGTSVADVQKTLAEQIDNDGIEFVVLDDPIESPVSELRDDVTGALTKAVQARYPDMSLSAYMESGATDGMHFRSAGVPTLAMSATIMNEEEMYAHGLNERIPVEAFYNGLDHWMIIIKELAGQKADD